MLEVLTDDTAQVHVGIQLMLILVYWIGPGVLEVPNPYMGPNVYQMGPIGYIGLGPVY